MQISPPTPAIISALAGTAAGLDKGDKAVRAPLDKSLAPLASPAAPVESGPEGAADTVSISAEVGVREPGNTAAAVYAEIWKGAVKVAQVDVHGHVTAYSGLAPSTAGIGSVGGPLLAAQRAVQVAQQTGGEIRAAGQFIDGQTLLMRARLADTYAV